MDYRAELEKTRAALADLHAQQDANTDKLHRLHREIGEAIGEAIQIEQRCGQLALRLELILERDKTPKGA